MPLSLEQIAELLKPKTVAKSTTPILYPAPLQSGPVRWYDTGASCASCGCGSQTYCKLQGVPYCMKHVIEKLNDMLIELGVIE